MSEIVITKNSIEESINKKLKRLDEIHNQIKNKFTGVDDKFTIDCYLGMYRDKVHEIESLKTSFESLCYNLKHN